MIIVNTILPFNAKSNDFFLFKVQETIFAFQRHIVSRDFPFERISLNTAGAIITKNNGWISVSNYSHAIYICIC